MRVGSGGVMLPNHAPLMVAERFKLLEALFPGRIDLGLGRAPGTDPATSYALRRRQGISDEDDFLERFQELMLLETRGFPAGPSVPQCARACRPKSPLPPIFLLGSSDYSAQLAGQIGAAFSFAHHFANFRRRRSDAALPRQLPPLGLARQALRDSGDARGLRRHRCRSRAPGRDRRPEFRAPRQGRISSRSPRREDAAAYDYAPVDRARIAQNRARMSVGAPATVKAQLEPLMAATKADELMVTTMIFDHEARKHSYELLAQGLRLAAAEPPSGRAARLAC